jgi:cobalt/nickel transport system permease protein
LDFGDMAPLGYNACEMHIPDGFLTNRVALSLDAVSAAGIVYAASRIKLEDSGRRVPMMGVLAAFVFAAQMLNFPVLGGTSGHLIGGALLGILLGPMAGFLTIATVVIAQALFLQDGGLIALGANIFNISAVTTFSGYAVFRLLGGARSTGRLPAIAGFLAGWLSLELSAATCALQMAVSGSIPLKIGLPAMVGYHAIIGIVEGGFTAGILTFLARVRPDLMDSNSKIRLGVADWIGGLVLVAVPAGILVLAGGSDLPDPLERLLVADSPAGHGTDPQSLALSGRLSGYLVRVALLVALVGVAYLCGRLARWRSDRA